ncbi:MAG: gliding motility-associated C-terminal domain-containing protein [Lewinellaceae bacterium]|nr:gliding motility-associated C-terminal domain-containing protein [Saprospiraceae bacterium]MCB9329837.1 gliding motility-associated C-terminal domain-containing protein [Lewinellaceae bacterium]
MNRLSFVLLFFHLFVLRPNAQSQLYFQNLFALPGQAFNVAAVKQLQGGQLAVGGQIVSTSTGNKIAALLLVSEAGTLIWARQLGTDTDQTAITALAATPDGKILAVVQAESATGTFGISKIDLNGTPEWSRFFSASGNNPLIRSAHISATGFVLTGNNNAAGLVKKTDANGIEIWSAQIAAPGATMQLHQAWEDLQGNIYAAGTLFQNGYSDGIVLKLSASGTLDWSRRFGTSDDDALFYLTPTTDQYLLAGGHSYGVDNYNKGWLLKIDGQGEIKWSRSYGEPGLNGGIRSLGAYPGGAVFSFSEDGNVPTLGAVLARVNTEGDLLWIKNHSQSGAFGLNPKLTTLKNNDILLAATLQTGSGKACLLLRANDKGDTPPCCLSSFNLQVTDMPIQVSVFVPTASTGIAMGPALWASAALAPQLTTLCVAPDLSFTISDSLLCPGDCIDFEITSPTPGANYSWTFPGGVMASGIPDRVCFPNLTDSVKITLTANACAYTQRQQTLRAESSKDQTPNAFTPNGDGINDLFFPVLFCPAPVYHLAIFNRWGSLVFESNEANKGWDGTVNGREAPADVYVWMLETQSAEGITRKKGDVTLLR